MHGMSQIHEWRIPPEEIALNDGEAHVWRSSIIQEPQVVSSLSGLLSPAEKERAARFYFLKDRLAFAVARGGLRVILSKYLKVDPRQIDFRYNFHGKPALAQEMGNDMLRFNLSHSGEIVLYAVSRDREIGIDVEQLKEDFASQDIAGQFFAPSEVKALLDLPPKLQKQAFFNCWTRKEAFIKAIGEGLSFPLDQFEVSLIPGLKPKLLSIRGSVSECSKWSLYDLVLKSDYAAAVAVEGEDCQLKFWDFLPCRSAEEQRLNG
ncbi:MAG: 4'-phosphopantetheinyl transferase superfamily protein [Chloracidobacterium sp.]|nr:4'-phosphopantetheinyl transferase superfamily protein [Chloracidobacterium sp.]